MTAMLAPRIRSRCEQPFRYRLLEKCLPQVDLNNLLYWLERDAPWQLDRTDFYEQYVVCLPSRELPISLAWTTSDKELKAARSLMENEFQCELLDRVEVVAHKLVPGQRIAIHNDYIPGLESHRLTLQLNRGLTDSDGGFFMLFNSSDAADVHRVLRPCNNTALAFEISSASNHAVSLLHGGTRFTLVYSFYGINAK